MSFLLGLTISLLLFGAVLMVAWKFSSKRISLPCPVWLAWLVELDNPIFRNNSARAIIAHLALEPGMHVLDMGCGPGRLTIPVAREIGPTGKVTAFDLQEGMLRRVEAKVQSEHLNNVLLVQGRAGEGVLGRDVYDRVLLVTVLGEIPNQMAALAEIFTCLKPGGFLSVTEVIADPHFHRRKTVTRLAESAGFVELGYWGNPSSYTIHFGKPRSQ